MLYYFSILLAVILPFQFALNPTAQIDLGIVRVIVPALFIFWLLGYKKQAVSFFRKPDYILGLGTLFLSLCLMSLIFSHNLGWSVRKLLFLFSILPLFFVLITVLEKAPNRRKLITGLVGGGALAALAGSLQFAAQFFLGIDKVYAFWATYSAPFFLGKNFANAVLTYPSLLVNSGGITYLRATAAFPDPHMFSYYLGMLLPWSLALWATSRSHKKLFLATSLLLFVTDILTFTRGGYVALIASALVILPLVSRLAAKKILLGVATLFLLLMLAPKNPVVSRLSSSADINEGSNHARLENWQQALPIIAKHPWGVGIGMYSLAVDPTASYREPIYAHNLYLDLAAELGILSALVFITLLLSALRIFWQKSKTDNFYIAGVASISVFAVHSLVENPLYSIHVLTLFVFILALSYSLSNHEQNI